ncbi:MAG: c-type cytochrome [Bacteroidota bacterium]|nr:c-type cytochrome [Bacteroidota bacterium]
MPTTTKKELVKALLKVSRFVVYITLIFLACVVITIVVLMNDGETRVPAQTQIDSRPVSTALKASAPLANSAKSTAAGIWTAPDTANIPIGKVGEMIRYGRDLISHTANYFGPQGSIAHISNGMNCQNCHLEGGSRLFGNNFASFISSYPKMSNRSGKIEPATGRFVECFKRSLGGTSPDTSKKETKAMLAYMKWIGQGIKKGQTLYGNATEKLPFLNNAADAGKGKLVYVSKCKSCHGVNGEGLFAADKKSYTYPPLWGPHSYNDGAGMYRIGNLAGFVKNNMPFGATYKKPQLTNEEAWNVAAFINSQPRLHKDQHDDWPYLTKKPIDFPFGPYADNFSEKQHKLGPFKPIAAYQKAHAIKKS